MRIGLNGLPFGPLHARLLIQHPGINSLTNSRDHCVTFHNELGTRNGHWATTTTGIWLTEFVTLELNTSYIAIFRDNTRLADIQLQMSPFCLAILNLFGCRTHLSAATAIHSMALRTQTQQGTRTA